MMLGRKVSPYKSYKKYQVIIKEQATPIINSI